VEGVGKFGFGKAHLGYAQGEGNQEGNRSHGVKS
jgi:hypothetical protein